jgi:hypothetical protein
VVLVAASDQIRREVADLSKASGHSFSISEDPVDGTKMYVVYTSDHPFRELYAVGHGVFGFRVPDNYPDACPEDSFFIQPADIKLKIPDATRNTVDIHRAGPAGLEYLRGISLGATEALVFSWHLWNRVAWDRNRHTLTDHYTHCIRRFEQPEHD